MQTTSAEQFLCSLLFFPDACSRLSIQIRDKNTNDCLVYLYRTPENFYVYELDHFIEVSDFVAEECIKYGLTNVNQPIIFYHLHFTEHLETFNRPDFLNKVIILDEDNTGQTYWCEFILLFRFPYCNKPTILEKPKLIRQIGYYKHFPSQGEIPIGA